jgi:multidrug resistance efflux pump
MGTIRRFRPLWPMSLLAATAIALALGGCGRLALGGGSARATQTAVAAATAEATRTGKSSARPTASHDVERIVTADGRIASALEPLPLSFPSAGTVTEVLVTAGQQVGPGEALARMDTLALDLGVADAKASLAQAINVAARTKRGSDVDSARLQLEQAKNQLWGAQARRDSVCGSWESWKNLPDDEQGLLPGASQADCDGAQASVQSGEQAVQLAQVALEEAEAASPGDLTVAQSNVTRARLGVQQAEDSLARATLTSPFTATIEAVHVRPGMDVAPGSPVVTLHALGELAFVTTNLGERNVADIRPGAKAIVTLNAFPDEPFPAVVDRIGSVGTEDTTGGVMFPVYLTIDPGALPVRSGMTGRVSIKVPNGNGGAGAD